MSFSIPSAQGTGRLFAPRPYAEGITQEPLLLGPNEFTFVLPPIGNFWFQGVNVLYYSEADAPARVTVDVWTSEATRATGNRAPVSVETYTTPGQGGRTGGVVTLNFARPQDRLLPQQSRIIVSLNNDRENPATVASITLYGLMGWRFA